MRDQTDMMARVVTLDILRAICNRASGPHMGFTPEIKDGRCVLTLTFHDRDTAVYTIYFPVLWSKNPENPRILLDSHEEDMSPSLYDRIHYYEVVRAKVIRAERLSFDDRLNLGSNVPSERS